MDSNRPRDLEVLFLRIFKFVLLVTMSIAIAIAAVFAVLAALNRFEQPKEPKPAASAPAHEISIDKAIRELVPPEEKKRDDAKGADNRRPSEPTAGPIALRYLEEATKLYRCSLDFSKKVGISVEQEDSAAAQRDLEFLRSNLEARATESPARGDAYVADAVRFTCATLANPTLQSAYGDRKLSGVFLKTLNFHLREWDRVQREKAEFDARERERVARERGEEEARIAGARATTIQYLIIAGFAFSVFMALALYLIFAKIETNLRDLSALRERRA